MTTATKTHLYMIRLTPAEMAGARELQRVLGYRSLAEMFRQGLRALETKARKDGAM